MAQGLDMNIKIEGLPELFRDLGKIDPELRKAAVKNVRRSGERIRNAARGNIPGEPPMSGWRRVRGRRGRWTWNPGQSRSRIRVKVGTGSVRTGDIKLLRIVQSDAAGSIYDMAGRRSGGSSPNGAQFIRNLNRKGRASRTMWPAAEANRDEVEQDLRQAIDDMADTVNRKLR